MNKIKLNIKNKINLKDFLLTNSGANIYKIFTISLLLVFTYFLSSKTNISSQLDSRLLANHPACSCPSAGCQKTTVSGNGAAVTCSLNASPDCDTPTGLAADCSYISGSGGCGGDCASGWDSSCPVGYTVIDSGTVNCHYRDNPPCSNNTTCYKCAPPPPVSCPCSSTCNSYTATPENTGVTACVPQFCPATLIPTACQNCNAGTPGVLVPKTPINGVAGSCGGSDGQSNMCSNPTASCASGTLTSSTNNGIVWTWSCVGTTGSCGGSNGATDNCSASKQNPITDSDWGSWSSWGSCDVACGMGTQERSRPCIAGTSCGADNCTPGTTDYDTQACNAGCCPADGLNAICGSSDGGTFSSTPSTNLCSAGSASLVAVNPTTYSWTCLGTAGSCGGFSGTDTSCSASRLVAPSFSSFELRNQSNTVVNSDVGTTINQTCDQIFTNSVVRFVVTATDPNNDITSIQLRVGGQTHNPTTLLGGIATFDIAYPSPSTSTTGIETNITDSTGLTTGWVSVGRSLKIWDCNVSISGSLFDGSLAPFGLLTDCSASSAEFTNKVNSALTYNLTYNSFVPPSALDRIMSISSPDYNQGSEYLRWGVQYEPIFTNINGQTPKMRIPGNSTCQDYLTLNSALVNPYSATPSLTIDFASILNQPAWFQVLGGGLLAKNSITNNIPSTCTDTCTPVISLNDGFSSAGIVAAGSITKGAGTFSQNNDSNVLKNIIGTDYSYKYFYNEYYVKLNQGSLFGNGSNTVDFSTVNTSTGGTGVVFINGNLNIDVSNSIPQGSFAMYIVKGSVTVNQSVDNVAGIFITDNNFTVSGNSSNVLAISGVVYSGNNVELSRGFTVGTDNNKAPSVVVQYRPDFIFSMPGKLTKILSGWREGI